MAHRHGNGWRGSVQVPGIVAPFRKGGFPTKTAAERWERDTAVDFARGSYRDPDAGRITFGDWAAKWLATRGTLKRSSSVAEVAILETHLRPAFGKVRIDQIGPTAVRSLVSSLAETKAPKTVRNIHAVLSGILSLAVEEGLLLTNPCVGTRLPRNKRRKARSYLTEQQVEQIIAAVPSEHRALVTFLATTGLRWGEATGLRVQWVDLLNRRLRVEETLNEAAGVQTFGTPKSEASIRTIRLSARTVDVLIPLVSSKNASELVFTTSTGLPIRHRNFYTRCWVPTMTALGMVDPRPSIHDLRHHHAALLVSGGAPMTAVKERLGHDSMQTTDKLYAFLLPPVDDLLLAIMDAAYSDPLSKIHASAHPPVIPENEKTPSDAA